MKPGKSIAAMLLLWSAGASAAPPVPPSPHPALWRLTDTDTTIYLFGTIHALPAGYRWQDARLGQVVAQADRLVIEALVGNPAESAALLMRLATSPGLPPLAARVKPSQRARLARLIKASGVPGLDALETWAAALILGSGAINKLALSTDDGVEERLKAQFAAAHKPVEAFETPEIQLGFFDTLPEKDQRAFLSGVIDEPQDPRPEFDRMMGAWARGDEKAIARTFDKEMKGEPGLGDALLARRNQAWSRALIQRLGQPGTTLVAVGAGHLAGRGSVQAMLARAGYAVERLR